MGISRRESFILLSSLATLPLSLKAQSAAVSEASGEYSLKTQENGSLLIESSKKEVKFRIGKDAFLMRKNSKIEISSDNLATKSLSLLSGGVMGVFGGGEKTIITKTFAAGIRGTGIYLEELKSGAVYSCLCYGMAEYKHPQTQKTAMTLKSIHHDRPVAISRVSDEKIEYWLDKTQNHDDDELRELEKMCGREVPFEAWLILNGNAAYGH